MYINEADIKKVFSLMRKRGIVARRRFADDQDLAFENLKRMAECRLQRDKGVRGFAYYGLESEVRRRRGLNFWIVFGDVEDRDGQVQAPATQIGEIVCDCLSDAGIPWWWSGRHDCWIEVVQADASIQAEGPDEKWWCAFCGINMVCEWAGPLQRAWPTQIETLRPS